MSTYLGALHWLGFKPQASGGVAETSVTTFLPTTSISLEANQKPIPRKAWLGSGIEQPPRKGPIAPNGKCTAEVLASVPEPWYYAMGACTSALSASGVPAASGVYSHVITDGGAPIRLTVEADRVHTMTRQRDVYLDKVTLKAEAGKIAMLEMEWFALGHEDGLTLTSTTVFADDVLVVMSGNIEIEGSPDTTIEEFGITWDNGLRAAATIAASGEGAPSFVRREGPPKCTGKVKFVDFPAAEYARLANAEQFTFEAVLDSDVIVTDYLKQLGFYMPICTWTDGMQASITGDTITAEAGFQAYGDSPMTVTAQNTVSNIKD